MNLKIKDTLTLRFVLVFALLWIMASLAIYYSSAEFRRDEFYQRLKTKATTAAKLLIEVEEVDAQLLQKIEAANPMQLLGEQITIYDYNNHAVFSTDAQDSIAMRNATFDAIRLEGEVSWIEGDLEVLGLLYADQYERFVVVASGQDVYGNRKLNNLRNILLVVFFISILVIAFAARLYAGKALQPISEVIEEVNKIGFGNLSVRVSEGNGKDEIAVLGITFNRMLSRLQRAFESQKSFITNASHELRTPMTSILSQVDVVLLKDREIGQYKETLHSIREDVGELSVLAGRLLLLARVDAFRETFQPIRIDTILWQAVADVGKYFSNQIVTDFSGSIDDDRFLTVLGSEQLIKSVFQNLLENACKYSENEEVRVFVDLKGEEISISIQDRGIGIRQSDLPKVGQPFFRGANTGNFSGSGIGLNLVGKIMEIHGGAFELTSDLDEGTRVTVTFCYIQF